MRQVVLDTETTGLHVAEGHRILEIGAVELIDRKPTGNNYHQYIQPEREIDEEALAVHGITPEFLADKPVFKEVAAEFFAYIEGAELVIHNAPFDVGFMDAEFQWLKDGYPAVADVCGVLDTLVLAKKMHPTRKSLDALARYYEIDSKYDRTFHGALLDAQILADVYLAMTGGQTKMALGSGSGWGGDFEAETIRRLPPRATSLPVLKATSEELAAHEERLDFIASKSNGDVLWRKD